MTVKAMMNRVYNKLQYLDYHPWWSMYGVSVAHPDLPGGFKTAHCMTKWGAMRVARRFAANPYWWRVTVYGRSHPFGPYRRCVWGTMWRRGTI